MIITAKDEAGTKDAHTQRLLHFNALFEAADHRDQDGQPQNP